MPAQLARRSPGAILPPPRVSLSVRQAVIADGARPTAARLGLSDTTVARIAARLPCHRASIELAARRLGIDLDDKQFAAASALQAGIAEGGAAAEE